MILCDGGFQAAPDLLRQYVGTDKVKLRAADTAVGDGLRMGLSAGGVAVQMRGFYGHVLARAALDNDALWPYPILDQLAAVGVVVGPRGDRFVDEGYSGVNTTNQIAWSATPLDNWLIVDDEAWEHHGRQGVTPPNPHIAEHGGEVLSAPTIEMLASLAGIDPGGLAHTVAELSRSPSTATPPRSGDLHLEVQPFHAIPVVAGVTFTLGGLRVDGSARVVDSRRRPDRRALRRRGHDGWTSRRAAGRLRRRAAGGSRVRTPGGSPRRQPAPPRETSPVAGLSRPDAHAWAGR